MKNSSIDINQRIPLFILEVGLQSFLEGTYSNEYIQEQLALEYSGENRIKKGLRIVNKIIKNNPANAFILEHKDQIQIALRNKFDKPVLLIALLNLAFPFSFDVLRHFGKFFSVQDLVNSATIKRDISGIYGGNRATENGLYSVIPMFIEANLFNRPRTGLYEFKEESIITQAVTLALIKMSFDQNYEYKDLGMDTSNDVYFKFFKMI